MSKKNFQVGYFYAWYLLCSLIVVTNAEITSPLSQSSSEPIKHFIIFDEIGEMASSMTYIHVQIPLNCSTLYAQAATFTTHLQSIVDQEFSQDTPKPFADAIVLTAKFHLKRALRKIAKFKSVDDNLPKIQSKFKRSVVNNVPVTHPYNIEDLFLTDNDKL